MKFKYMIRGFGIGVIVTAAVMGAYNRQAVADARVAVLKEYGIGAEKALAVEPETSEETSEITSTEDAAQPVIVRDEGIESEIHSVLDAAKESEQSAPTQDEASGSGAADAQPEGEEGAQEPPSGTAIVVAPEGEDIASGETVQIEITRGDDSGTISRKLYNAGLIENASEYDAYLMQHGYDKKLSTGTKSISASDSWLEIAEKLTTK